MFFGRRAPTRFPMKVSVLDIHPHRQTKRTRFWRVFADGRPPRRPSKAKHGRIFTVQHIGGEMHLNATTVTGARDKVPFRGWTGMERDQAPLIQRGNKSIGYYPRSNAFRKDM